MSALLRDWWAVALRGLFAVIFGVLAIAWPGITLLSLVFLFGAYAFMDGVFALVSAVKGHDRRWLLALEGVAGIGAGIVAFAWPGMTGLVLLYLIAIWAIVTGVLEIAAAIGLRKVIEGEVLLALAGVLSILFGVLLLIWPGAGALALVSLIAAYALVFGVLLIALGLRLRGLRHPRPGGFTGTAAAST